MEEEVAGEARGCSVKKNAKTNTNTNTHATKNKKQKK